MKLASLALATLLWVAGCATSEAECEPDTHEIWDAFCGGDFSFDSNDFEPSERAALLGSAERWNAFTGATLVQVHTGAATCTIVKGKPPQGKAAWYDFASGTITIDTSQARDIKRTITHEIGHSLGFQHARLGGVMCSTSRDEFNESDHTQCVQIGLCK